MGSDLTVVNAARVSFDKESETEKYTDEFDILRERLSDKDAKLIGYLARHGHWTPFAHAQLQFRVSAPIFVARQLVKHQVGLVWNEVSRRYVDDEPVFYFPEWRNRPDASIKQGSAGPVDKLVERETTAGLRFVCKTALDEYVLALEAGIAPEQARIMLPQNTMTSWYWTGSLMAFARVCKQRLDPHAQQETREVAQGIHELTTDRFPVAWAALNG